MLPLNQQRNGRNMDQPGQQPQHDLSAQRPTKELNSPQSTHRAARKKAIIGALLLVTCVIAVVVWALLPPSEPKYKDQPMSFWLTKFTESANPYEPEDVVTVECRDALQHIGTNAIPPLLRMMRTKDSDWSDRLRPLLWRLHLQRFDLPARQNPKTLAQAGFFLLGDLATNAIPDLIDIYKHSASRYSQFAVDSVLQRLYPAPGADSPSWLPETNRVEWFNQAGNYRVMANDSTNAARAFTEVIRLDPTNARAYTVRGDTRIMLRDFPGALLDLNKAISLQPSNEDAFVYRGTCYANMREPQKAEADFTTAITINTNNTDAYNYRGLARMNQRKFDSAMGDFEHVIDLNPREPTAYRNRAIIEMYRRDLEVALEDVSKSIQMSPKDPASYSVRATILASLKDYRGALADLDQVISFNPTDFLAYATRGAVHVYTDEFDKADADIKKALELRPDFASAMVARAFLAAKRENGPDAIADLEHAIESNPLNFEAVAMLGLLQYRFADRQDALKNIDKALHGGVQRNDSELRAYKWLIRTQAGEKDLANSELHAFLNGAESATADQWTIGVAKFFTGAIPEKDFLALAPKAVRRPSEIKGQVTDSLYYAAMKRKLSGDIGGARALFQQCLDTKYDNAYGYLNALAELAQPKTNRVN
jgi:tetratricopeptide (TPR) repeat protein